VGHLSTTPRPTTLDVKPGKFLVIANARVATVEDAEPSLVPLEMTSPA
jgi:hypothetical protein